MFAVQESVERKVAAVFGKSSGARVLNATTSAGDAQEKLCRALAGSYSQTVACEMAFHLTDWTSDAAFLVALVLHPERFKPAEIRAGVMQLLLHVPQHVIAAARLGGHPAEDIFLKTGPEQRLRAARKSGARSARRRAHK